MTFAIFPAQALDSSVITTVWIGLCVVTMLNLRFGTTLAGLVVPGYLVPLLLVKPISAGVIWVEALVTYVIAKAVADALMRATGSCTMFGRDRFFALLLISVFVRVTFDGWLLPLVGQQLAGAGLVFDYHNNLHSFGLVIVALTANQMWNAGMARGTGTFLLYVGITWAIVRWVLVPLTNFDIAGLGFVYEDVASDIFASPKAYLILLTTAFVASRMNLHYGWEFSGILIPSLLALQWFQPTKLLISVAEAVIILVLGRLVLSLPALRRVNMEGSRLLLLLFTLGYLYKLLLGFYLAWAFPTIKASDYFAMGYLLSTLLAAKMLQKQITVQMARTTVQVSLMGLVAATAIGYGLQWVWPPAPRAASAVVAVPEPSGPSLALADRLASARRALHASEAAAAPLRFDEAELLDFDAGVRAMLAFRSTGNAASLEEASAAFQRSGYVLERSGPWWLVRDRDPGRGSGVFGIHMSPRTSLLVAVPMPLDEPGSFDAAMHLVESEGHAAFASAGTRRERLPEGRSHPLRNARLPFARFHAIAGAAGVLHVRGLATAPGEDPPAELWVQRELPSGLYAERLDRLAGAMTVRFGRRSVVNPLRDATRAPFAELMLGRPARLRLVARSLDVGDVRLMEEQQRVDGYLHDWLMARREAIADAGSGRYALPGVGDLLYLQSEVVEPLFGVAARWSQDRDLDALRAIDAVASRIGYRVVLHRHITSGEEHAVLAEAAGGDRHWGTLVLRLGEAAPYVVAIPRPVEERYTFEYGVRLFARLRARAALITGAHSAAREDGLADVLDPVNPNTFYNAAYQSLVLAQRPEGWVIQIRGRRHDDTTPAAGVVASFVGRPPAAVESARVETLLEGLGGASGPAVLAGQTVSAPMQEAGLDPASAFLRALPEPVLVVVSVSSATRRTYRDVLVSDPEAGRYAAAEVPTERADVAALVSRERFGEPPSEALVALIDEAIRTGNVVALASAEAQVPSLRRVLDPGTGRTYLRIGAAGGAASAWRSLDPMAMGHRDASRPGEREAFKGEDGAWLYAGGAR